MNTHSNTSQHTPHLSLDTDAIKVRLRELADAETCPSCELDLTHAIADIARLIIEVTRLHKALIDSRLDAANLRAAIQAALGADADGDPDALEYLRDELAEQYGDWGRE